MEKIIVHVEAEINPTELEEKVKRAVENMFGTMPTQTKKLHKGSLLVADSEGQGPLTSFGNLLRRERIRSAARAVFFEGLDRQTISFCLNKQVAFAGHISFSKEVAESPLGPIRVRIECDNPQRIINWLAPKRV